MSQDDSNSQPDPTADAWLQRPAGFWIRVVATIVDALVMLPLMGLNVFAFFQAKSMALYLIASVPGFFYKPLMESHFGATVGKMVCGIRVIDVEGRNLNLGSAYLRFLPWMVASGFSVANALWVFRHPDFQSVNGFRDLGLLMASSPMSTPANILNWLIILSVLPAAFTERKRAVHDMISGSYCVYRAT